MRINSDKQTLILAGEATPRRDIASSSANGSRLSDGPRLTIVATRADQTMLLAHGDFAHKTSTGTENSNSLLMPLMSSQSEPVRPGLLARGASFNAANEYARTQDFSGYRSRTLIIDTYA